MDIEATSVIEALGGPTAVAKLCGVTVQAISQWKDSGIPPARRQYLAVLRPDLFRLVARERALKASERKRA